MKRIFFTALLLIPFTALATGIGIGGDIGTSQPAQTGTIAPPPSVFEGGTSAPDLSAPPSPDAASNTSVQGRANEQQSAAASAADIASQVTCGRANTGAALQQALSGLGNRLGQAALNGVANGLSSYGSLGRAAGSILTGEGVGNAARGLVGSAGNYAGNAIGQEIAGACGDSSLGHQICGTVGSAVGNYVEGAINQYGGQILNSVGVGNIGQIFGGSGGGGALSGVTNIIGGGPSQVPVSCQGCEQQIQRVQQINTGIQRTVTHTDEQTAVLVHNVCESQPTVAALQGALVNQNIATVLGLGAQQHVTNRSGDLLQARLSEASRLLNDPSLTTEQKAQISQWVNDEINGVPSCTTAPNNRSPIGQLLDLVSYNENCSDAALYDRLQRTEQAGEDAYTALTTTTNGPRPPGVCGPEGLNAGQLNHPELCPTTYHPSESSGNLAAVEQRAEGHVFDISASAIGTAANNLVADLLNQIFTTVADEAESGLARLISNRGGGSNRSHSYIDMLSGNVGPTQQQGMDFLTSNVTESISIEAQYQDATQIIIDSLTTTQTVFKNIQACYTTLAQTPVSGITSQAAAQARDNASTTVTVVLGRQITAREQNFTASQSAVHDLGILLDSIQAATHADQINALADTYDAMQEAGRLHTTEQLQLLADDVNQLVPALSLAEQDAGIQLTQCQAYGTATTGG